MKTKILAVLVTALTWVSAQAQIKVTENGSSAGSGAEPVETSRDEGVKSVGGTVVGGRFAKIIAFHGPLVDLATRRAFEADIANRMLTNGPLNNQISTLTPGHLVTSQGAIFWGIVINAGNGETIPLTDAKVIMTSIDRQAGSSTNILGATQTFRPSDAYNDGTIGIRPDGSRIANGLSANVEGSQLIFSVANNTFNATEQEVRNFLSEFDSFSIRCDVYVKDVLLTSLVLSMSKPPLIFTRTSTGFNVSAANTGDQTEYEVETSTNVLGPWTVFGKLRGGGPPFVLIKGNDPMRFFRYKP